MRVQGASRLLEMYHEKWSTQFVYFVNRVFAVFIPQMIFSDTILNAGNLSLLVFPFKKHEFWDKKNTFFAHLLTRLTWLKLRLSRNYYESITDNIKHDRTTTFPPLSQSVIVTVTQSSNQYEP